MSELQGPAAAPKRQVKVAEPIAAGNGELPREDISGKITEATMPEMASTDWKVSRMAPNAPEGTLKTC